MQSSPRRAFCSLKPIAIKQVLALVNVSKQAICTFELNGSERLYDRIQSCNKVNGRVMCTPVLLSTKNTYTETYRSATSK